MPIRSAQIPNICLILYQFLNEQVILHVASTKMIRRFQRAKIDKVGQPETQVFFLWPNVVVK